ncbi:MAG: hypothetical protein AAF546_10200 [Verrucomicrobiota bacterium]
MNQKNLIATIISMLLLAACFVYFAQTQEIRYDNGKVESLRIKDSGIVIDLRKKIFESVVIECGEGNYTFPVNITSKQLIISENGIYGENGNAYAKWDKLSSFAPASSFSRLNRRHFLGTIESSKGRSQKLYYSQEKS